MPTFHHFQFKKYPSGLKSLSPENQDFLHTSIQLYDDAYLQYPGVKLQRLEAYRQEFHAALHTSNADQFKEVKNHYIKAKGFEEYVDTCKQYQSSQTWHMLLKHVPLEQRLVAEQIRTDWQRHGKFAHYSSEAVWFIASHLLPTLEQHIRTAKQELLNKKAKLMEDFSLAYEGYLNDFLRRIEKEKQCIAAAMLVRLQIACITQDPTNDDLLHYLGNCVASWQQLNIKPPETYKRCTLTPEVTQHFKQYLGALKHPSVEARLQQLQWFANTMPTAEAVLLEVIPSHLMKWVEPKPARFPSLFAGHQFRHSFLKGKVDLLARIAQSPIMFHAEMKDIAKSPARQFYDILDQQLQADIQEAVSLRQGFNSVLHRKTCQFLHAWRSHLINARKNLLLNKREVATLWMDQWEQGKVSSAQVADLKQYLQQLRTDLKSHAVPTKEIEALQLRLQKKMIQGESKRSVCAKTYPFPKRRSKSFSHRETEPALLNPSVSLDASESKETFVSIIVSKP